MTKRTRLFLGISAGILVAGLGTGLVASYLGFQPLTIIGSNGPDELEYLPHDSRLVAFANVRDIMQSELRQRLQALGPADDTRRTDFQARTGINVETDIDTVIVSITPGIEMGPSLMIARGRFDAVRIEGLMREQGGEAVDYEGTRVVTISGDNRDFGVAFVEPGLLAFGAADAVRRAIDVKNGVRANVTTNEELMTFLDGMDDGNAWAVGRFDAFAHSGRIPRELSGQLPPITWFGASGDIDGGIEALLHAEASNDQAANDLRQVIQGFMALARLQAGQNPALAGLLESVRLGGEGKTVSLAFAVPADAVNAIASMRRPGSRPVQPQ